MSEAALRQIQESFYSMRRCVEKWPHVILRPEQTRT
jgi:hypothetical protein